MLPRVDTASPAPGVDRRKTLRLSWTEARLCLVRGPGAVTPRVGGTMGSVEAAGPQLWEAAVAAGRGERTRVHAVGDGAPWIADQVERRFGAQATYLVDFYHVCDYLAAAAPAAWLAARKATLKANGWAAVLDTLRPAVEPDDLLDDAAPSARVSAISPVAPRPWTTTGRWLPTCRSAPGRSTVRIGTSCRVGSSAPARGGPLRASTQCACAGPTASGTATGAT